MTFKISLKLSIMVAGSLGLLSMPSLATRTGFYIGPMFGNSSVHTSNEVVSGNAGVLEQVAQSNTRSNAFLIGAIGGWGYKSGFFYGGVELDGFHANISKTIVRNDQIADESMFIKNTYQLGGGIRFGVVGTVNPDISAMPYVRLGFQASRYERKYTVMDNLLPGGMYSNKSNEGVFSVVPALGIEMNYKQKVSVRLEGRYAPTFTRRLFTGTATTDFDLALQNSTLYNDVTQKSLILSAVYYFGC